MRYNMRRTNLILILRATFRSKEHHQHTSQTNTKRGSIKVASRADDLQGGTNRGYFFAGGYQYNCDRKDSGKISRRLNKPEKTKARASGSDFIHYNLERATSNHPNTCSKQRSTMGPTGIPNKREMNNNPIIETTTHRHGKGL